MTHGWQKHRAKVRKHAKLMRERPELGEALYGSDRMAPAMRKLWDKPIERPNILQQARDREIGLDQLYPAPRQALTGANDLLTDHEAERSPHDRNSRNSEKD
jgi:hypothetical protein